VKIQTRQGEGTTGLPCGHKHFVVRIQAGQGERANRAGLHPDMDEIIIQEDMGKTTNMAG